MVYTSFTYPSVGCVRIVGFRTHPPPGRCSLHPALIARRRCVNALLCLITIACLQAPTLTVRPVNVSALSWKSAVLV